jgi:hypothetical protein
MRNKGFIIICILCLHSFAHSQIIQKHKIAIFCPLYLDSAFDATSNYKPDKTFPKLFSNGLDFFQGAQLAIDSLKKRMAPLEVYVYDTKSKAPWYQQLNNPELKDVELILGITNSPETKILADAAFQKKVPFISAALPNDAGITANPYYLILNSTLQSHIENIYRFLQKYYSLDKIIMFRKKGTQEDQILNNFNDVSKNTASVPLSIKYVDLPSDFSGTQLTPYMDSTQHSVCICGSLDELFGLHLAHELLNLTKRYPLTLIGMPTWENLNFSKSEFDNLDIIYTASFYYDKSTLANQLATTYASRMYSKPTDLFLRGYETTLRFSLLLLETKKDLASNLSRKGNIIFTPFDIQPVFRNKKTMTLDYFENKHVYFLKVLGGVKNILY